ncbi:MAG: hypothetical protein GY950_28980 [bacterium]|nr:hypothetical protein [bacterium]
MADKSNVEEAKSRSWESYETFISQYRVVGPSHYFKTDEPGKCGGYTWISAGGGWTVLPFMREAFQQGKKIRVWVGYPFINRIDNSKAATIKEIEIERY